MNIKFLMRSVLAAFVAAALVASQAQAQTQSAPEGEKPAKSKPKKAAKSGSKAKFIPGSGETVAQRTARLKRECKGAVDAGVCSGYTR